MIDRCPTCRARLAGEEICPRCKSDLMPLYRVAQEAEYCRHAAVLALQIGEFDEALELARKASVLRRTPELAELEARIQVVRGEFSSYLRHITRRNRIGNNKLT